MNSDRLLGVRRARIPHPRRRAAVRLPVPEPGMIRRHPQLRRRTEGKKFPRLPAIREPAAPPLREAMRAGRKAPAAEIRPQAVPQAVVQAARRAERPAALPVLRPMKHPWKAEAPLRARSRSRQLPRRPALRNVPRRNHTAIRCLRLRIRTFPSPGGSKWIDDKLYFHI